MRLVILTGASGAGKTAIADAIEATRPGLAKVLHFDSVGVPSLEAMVAGWGSGEAWQRATTIAWMTQIAGMGRRERIVLLEGQMRPAFVREGLRAAGLADCALMLVDCDDETRARRLSASRNQPELADATMMRWAAYLREQARDAGYEIIDTSGVSLAVSVALVRQRLIGQ